MDDERPLPPRAPVLRPPPGTRWRVDTARATPPPAIFLEQATVSALARPVAGPPLRDLANPRTRVTVVVPDTTRACPTAALLTMLLSELREAGVSERRVTVVVALGMHRRLRGDERRTLLGPWADRLQVVEAQGSDAAEYRDLGVLAPGETSLSISIPVRLHPATQDADLLVSIGLVEPHQYAGWSGGRKTVAIGCAAAETISALHGPAVLEHPGTRLTLLEGNPLHRALEAVAHRAGLRFVLNLALDGMERPIAVASGSPTEVLADLVARAAPHVECFVDSEPYDAILAGMDPHKAVNLYQATRALTYVAFAPEPVVREHGWIVAEAACPEGAGEGPGEQAFLRAMRAGRTPDGVLEHVRRARFEAGAQRAFLVAKALLRYRLLMVGMKNPDLASACGLDVAPDLPQATRILKEILPEDARVLVVPNAFATVPVPRAIA